MVETGIAGVVVYYITVIKMRSFKSFIYGYYKAALGKTFSNFCKSPMVLLIFDVSIFRCSQNVKCSSSIIPRCLWDEVCGTWILLKNNGGWLIFFNFRLKMTSWVCLLGFGLYFIFHWKAQLLTLVKSLFSSFADAFMSCVTENKHVSSANINIKH